MNFIYKSFFTLAGTVLSYGGLFAEHATSTSAATKDIAAQLPETSPTTASAKIENQPISLHNADRSYSENAALKSAQLAFNGITAASKVPFEVASALSKKTLEILKEFKEAGILIVKLQNGDTILTTKQQLTEINIPGIKLEDICLPAESEL